MLARNAFHTIFILFDYAHCVNVSSVVEQRKITVQQIAIVITLSCVHCSP